MRNLLVELYIRLDRGKTSGIILVISITQENNKSDIQLGGYSKNLKMVLNHLAQGAVTIELWLLVRYLARRIREDSRVGFLDMNYPIEDK